MITIYNKKKGKEGLTTAKSISPNSWINVTGANERDLEEISRITGLTVADISDGLDEFEIPRAEIDPDISILFLRTPSVADEGLYTETLTVIVSESLFITLSPDENKSIQGVLDEKLHLQLEHPKKVLITVLDQIAKDYSRKIKRARSTILKQKQAANTSVDNNNILQLIHSEEILNQYLAALVPMKLALSNLAFSKNFVLTETEHEEFQDVQNKFIQSVEICNVILKSIRSLRDSYQILFTNNLNKNIRFLTSFTIIMTLPTIVASLFGMNVPLPFDGIANAFIYILILAFTVAAIFYAFFYYKKWL